MPEQETILIADDAEINRAILRSLFEGEYNLLEAENGEQALLLLHQYNHSIAAVLLDLVMPGKDGYEVLEEMRQTKLLFHCPAIVITADDSTDNRVKVFELGASDIIAKPFEPEVVKSRVKNIIELGRYRHKLENLVEEQSLRVRESNIAVIDMLSSVIEYRSLESGQHIRRIRMFTKILLEDVAKNYQEYNLDAQKIRLITESSSMHDIGKIAIPDCILNKPGKLTPEEFEVMKTHTVKGCEILSGLDRLQDPEYLKYAYQICRYHHERWNGQGYPDGLKENSIPICAQVVSIADCYDALTTDRVYKKAISPVQAFSMILNGECGQFSPRLLECLKNVREPFSRLSKEYADGVPVNIIPVLSSADTLPSWEASDSTSEQSQFKYFTLLRYLDCTVMEVDLTTGIYHLVYLSDPSFSALHTGICFEDSIRAFADKAVHPDDRNEVLRLLGDYTKELFDEGMLWRDRTYRVLDRNTDVYVQCHATLLRINLDNPRLRRVLLIWNKNNFPVMIARDNEANVPLDGLNPFINNLLGGINKCRSDQYFTILKACRSLLDILGYTEQEIAETYQNRLIDFIYPADRERVICQFREQRNAGKILEFEYRLIAKDGHIAWVSSRCMVVQEQGNEVTYGILLDITQSKKAEDELRLSLERHNIIMSQTNDIIFEWDILKDELSFSSNWEDQYGYAPITNNVRVEIPKASHIHPDDMPAFISLMDAMAAGVLYKETDFRIADGKGKYRWRRVRATAQFDLDGKPSKAVGVILDIDIEKKTAAELEKRVARDMLTGLYNNESAEVRVESYLADCGSDDLSVLMILDVDNFEHINRKFGHMIGDAVLAEIADSIMKLYRGDDTVARIGGDEFMIFMPNIRRENVAEHRAKEMISLLNSIMKGDLEGFAFSCSIGLAFARGNQNDFHTLYSQADWALYEAKMSGKNQFAHYQKERDTRSVHETSETVFARRTGIDSDESGKWNLPYLVIRIFGVLYDAMDFPTAVQSILSLIGELFGASRTYVFENSRDMEHCSISYEWCAKGITPHMQNLRDIPYLENGVDYRDHFRENGLFCCQNIRKLDSRERRLLEQMEARSTLQYAILENGRFHGFVGLDDCQICRLWTSEQLEALIFIGKLLSVFLMKDLLHTELVELACDLQNVLDNHSDWIYVVDPDTYLLQYFNNTVKQVIPEATKDQPCYKIFFQRDIPCEKCIIRQAEENGHYTMELFHAEARKWTLSEASIVQWNRRKAYLISGRDISAYKTKEKILE